MANLHDTVVKAVGNLKTVLHPLQEQDDRIRVQMNKDINLAQNLNHLGSRKALIQPRMETISHHKNSVEAAASKCEPDGRTKELLTAFFYLVKTLQSDCRKLEEEIQEWDKILNAVDSLHKEKQNLHAEESKRAKEILEMKVKEDKREDLLKLAWSVMSEEMRSIREEESNAPGGGDSTGHH